MSSPPSVTTGVQEPRVASCPRPAWTYGDEAIALAKSANLHLDPWQELLVRVIFAVSASGKWAARDVAYLVARQNGKGGVLEAVALYCMFLGDEREILWSAHEFKTAKAAYRRLKSLIQEAPHLYELVERRGTQVVGFRQSNEDTSITLRDGTVLRFMARSNQTGRGFSPQRLIVDEAQECSEDTRQALLYTISAQENPQVVWCGTVPSEKNNAEVFTSLRDRGRAGGDPLLAWLEWSVDPELGDMSDRKAWAQANPALGYRITMETIEAEWLSATTEQARMGFARERLSMWGDADDFQERWGVIDEHSWASSGWSSSDPAEVARWMLDPVSFGVEVSPDYAWASIAAVGDAFDGGEAVELIEHRVGTSWLVSRLVELVEHGPKHVVIDPRSPAAAFTEILRSHGVKVTEPKTAEVVRAAGSFYVGCTHGGVRHLAAEDQAPLDDAVATAQKRKVGDAWLWDSVPGSSPLRAATLALLGHRTAPEPEARSAYEDHDLTTV